VLGAVRCLSAESVYPVQQRGYKLESNVFNACFTIASLRRLKSNDGGAENTILFGFSGH